MHLTRRTALLATGASLATACASAQSPRALSWNTSRPPLPFPVQEIYPTAHKGRIHIAGGLLSDGTRVTGVSDRHIAYDPKTGVTTTLAALPAKRHHPYGVDHAAKLHLLGGFASAPDSVTWMMSTDTLAYDDTANAWSKLASAPEPHAETVAASIGSRIHIVGGRTPKAAANAAYGDHTDTDRHLVFDPAANTWSKAAPALTARNSAAGAMLNGLWHVAGGRRMSGGPTDAHEVYDPKEDKWRTATPLPTGAGAGGNAAAVLDGKLYAFGGEFSGGVHPEVWAYDPKTDAWIAAPPMPTPRHGLGAVALNNSIWLVGGAKKPSGSETSDKVESFGAA